MSNKKEVTPQQLRSFSWIVSGGFVVIGLAPLIRHHPIRMWALGVALVLAVMGLIFPPALKPVYRVWMAFGEALGWVNTRIILTIVYYLLIVPIGLILRATGNDPMRLKIEPDAETYRIPRVKRPISHMQRQY